MAIEMLFLSMLLALPCAASCVAVQSLPPVDFADTEVSTNIPLAVDLGGISRIEFVLSLGDSPTNSVEVSIGADADGDGFLSVWEVSHTFGYDCGAWFQRDAARNGELVMTGERQEGRTEKTFVLKKRKLDEAWNLVRVTRRGGGEVGELTIVNGYRKGFVLDVR